MQRCRHSSVDSSATPMLPPRVRVPSAPSMLYQFIFKLCHVEKDEITQKEAVIGPFLIIMMYGLSYVTIFPLLAAAGDCHSQISSKQKRFIELQSQGTKNTECAQSLFNRSIFLCTDPESLPEFREWMHRHNMANRDEFFDCLKGKIPITPFFPGFVSPIVQKESAVVVALFRVKRKFGHFCSLDKFKDPKVFQHVELR